MRRRRLLIRGALAFAVVYAALWAATAVWGPSTAERWVREQELARYGAMGFDSEQSGRQLRRLRGFTVPAPFVVAADWEYGGPRGGGRDYSEGSLWGWWLPGQFWVVWDHMTMVACG